MEGSALTEATLQLFAEVYALRDNVGPVLQAYLKRTPEDVARMIQLGARVRLCKGAYKERPEIAFRDMPTIRRAFMRLAETLLAHGNYPGIATHDHGIHEAVKTFARERAIPPSRFEFQMLFGVRPDLQRKLAAEGYNVRVYVPYGTHWKQYFYRRIRERRENAFLALRALVGR
jgi:proline dehydrogenase